VNALEYKAALEALTEKAWEDGFQLVIENECNGCCSAFVAFLVPRERGTNSEPVAVDL
jgi:hypothetical protein